MMDTLKIIKRQTFNAADSGKISPCYDAVIHSATGLEMFRNLDNEFYLQFGKHPFSLLLSSPNAQAGRTTLCLMLAVLSIRRAKNSSVILIDCTRSFDSVRALGMNPAEGLALSDCPAGEIEQNIQNIIMPTCVPGLDVCQVFSPDDNCKIMPFEQLEYLKQQVARCYQRSFIDSEPASKSKDYLALAGIFKNLLLVTRYGNTRKQQLAVQVKALKSVPCKVLGSTINYRRFVLPRWLYGRQ